MTANRLRGSCHCGRIRFEVKGEPASGLACNCSICRRRGSQLWSVRDVDLDALPVQHFDGRAL